MVDSLKARFGYKNITAEMLGFYTYKQLRQSVIYRPSVEKIVAPIFACQRSGTSVMLRVFFWDKDNVVYREGGSLSTTDPEGLRLDPLDMVAEQIRAQRAPLIVLKPLVESQNATQFLDVFPEARPIWLYRHYRDVAASNLREFGQSNGIDDIRPFVEGDQDNWRSQNASAETRALVRNFFSEDMAPHDAAALFWYARNQLFFDQQLDANPRVLLVSYRDFVTDPAQKMREMYAHFERPFPGPQITKEVHSQSLNKGSSVTLDPEIEALCEEMFHRLEAARPGQPTGAVRQEGMQ